MSSDGFLLSARSRDDAPGLWRTVDGMRSRSGDDYCTLHGEFRCPDCEQADDDLAMFDEWFDRWEIDSE